MSLHAFLCLRRQAASTEKTKQHAQHCLDHCTGSLMMSTMLSCNEPLEFKTVMTRDVEHAKHERLELDLVNVCASALSTFQSSCPSWHCARSAIMMSGAAPSEKTANICTSLTCTSSQARMSGAAP
eukprot:scaffold65425_cov22-Tisochrysis_lutea.AAC.9